MFRFTIQETLPIVKAQGNVTPLGLVVSVDRMERGQGEKSALAEIGDKYGLKTTAFGLSLPQQAAGPSHSRLRGRRRSSDRNCLFSTI